MLSNLDIRRKRLGTVVAMIGLVLALAPAAQAGQSTALDRAVNAGWHCEDVAGAMHCFDPGDAMSANASTINVKVFDYGGAFEGTEHIWINYHEQPCPQDHLLDLGFGIACHHYSHA